MARKPLKPNRCVAICVAIEGSQLVRLNQNKLCRPITASRFRISNEFLSRLGSFSASLYVARIPARYTPQYSLLVLIDLTIMRRQMCSRTP